jgi:hypothetical protein
MSAKSRIFFLFSVNFQRYVHIVFDEEISESRIGIGIVGDALGKLIEDWFKLPRVIDDGLLLIHFLGQFCVASVNDKLGDEQRD